MSVYALVTAEALRRHASAHSVSEDAERAYRVSTIAFIVLAGEKLYGPAHAATATAAVFAHRFFARHSYQSHNRYAVAQACLFLAGKVEEVPRKLRDVLLEASRLLAPQRGLKAAMAESMAGGKDAARAVMRKEKILLYTCEFDVCVAHAGAAVGGIVREWAKASRLPEPAVARLERTAASLAFDSIYTTLCIRFPAAKIAAACVHVAALVQVRTAAARTRARACHWRVARI